MLYTTYTICPEESIQILIDDGVPTRVVPVVEWDMNLTFPHDVLECNLYQLRLLGKETLIGEGCRIHPKARIKNSVIGDNVTIKNPIEIVDTVVFSGSVVTVDKKMEGVIQTPAQLIDCKLWLS